MKKLFGLFLTFVFIIGLQHPESSKADDQSSSKKFYVVTKVSDGDTFWVEKPNGTKEKIRLIGIDAPESRNTGQKKKGHYGIEAKNYLTRLILNKKVRLETDVRSKDRYGRLLAYAYLENGTFLNAHLVKNGYAMVYTVPPNVKFADEFVKLQKEARKYQRGLWGN
jgi:micrococcal nuclease